jgi:hypothetical protein
MQAFIRVEVFYFIYIKKNDGVPKKCREWMSLFVSDLLLSLFICDVDFLIYKNFIRGSVKIF